MKSDKSLREESHSSVSNVDSQDFGAIADDAGRFCNHKENRKAKQLCRQVAETLDLILSGDCRDELLQSLHVISVVPAPNSSRLLVTVLADLAAEFFDRREVVDLVAGHFAGPATDAQRSVVHNPKATGVSAEVLHASSASRTGQQGAGRAHGHSVQESPA